MSATAAMTLATARKPLHPNRPLPPAAALDVGTRVGAFRDLMICLGWIRLFHTLLGQPVARYRRPRRHRERGRPGRPRG